MAIQQIRSSGAFATQWMVDSFTVTSKAYKVSLRQDGAYECGCPSWIFGRHKRADPDCKHIHAIRQMGRTTYNTPVSREMEPEISEVTTREGSFRITRIKSTAEMLREELELIKPSRRRASSNIEAI